jgi:hypothetical protein
MGILVVANQANTPLIVTAGQQTREVRLYHYFSSKEELSLRCGHKSAAEVSARLRAIAAAQLAPGDKPRALFRAQALIEVREYRESLQ